MKELSSPDHPLIKELVLIRKERKKREETGLCLIEGKKTVSEIAKTRPLVHLLSTKTEDLTLPCEESFLISERLLEKISGCVHPEGPLATTALPKPSDLKGIKWILALDRLQDPGNVGTLIRTALGLGFEALFLVQGTCDIFHEKVLRATKGASLLIPYQEGTPEELMDLQEKLSIPLYAGDLKGRVPDQVEKAILVLGNEGQGLSPVMKSVAFPITIPLDGKVESLNVAIAGALLMAKLKGKL